MVDSLDSEEIAVAFEKSVDLASKTRSLGDHGPVTRIDVLLLNDVVQDVASAVVLRFPPTELASIAGDIARGKSLWSGWYVDNCEFHGSAICAVDVCRHL